MGKSRVLEMCIGEDSDEHYAVTVMLTVDPAFCVEPQDQKDCVNEILKAIAKIVKKQYQL